MIPDMNLFLLPYGGASSRVLLRLHKFLKADIKIHALDPPGRGARFDEQPLQQMTGIVDDLTDIHGSEFNGRYFFFGHSFGAMVAYYLSNELARRGLPLPDRLFLSGCGSPGSLFPMRHILEKTDGDFVSEFCNIGGSFPSKNEFPELYQPFLDTLRADLRVVSDDSCPWNFIEDIPFTVFWSKDDFTPFQDIKNWANFTNKEVRYVELTGNHFTMISQLQRIGSEILVDVQRESMPVRSHH